MNVRRQEGAEELDVEGTLSQLTNVNKVNVACEGLPADLAAMAAASGTRCVVAGSGVEAWMGGWVGWNDSEHAGRLASGSRRQAWSPLTSSAMPALAALLQPAAADGAAQQAGAYRGA